MPHIAWQPNPGPQTEFLASPVYEVLFGGAAGGGKSDALLLDAIGQAHRPRYSALLLRRSYPELSELIQRSQEIYPAAYPGAHYNRSERVWRFPSGARLEFGYVSADDDVYRYQGREYTWIGWDEVTHYSEWAYTYLMSRCRTTDPELRPYIRATANPGGKGHAWVKSRFIDPVPPNTVAWDAATETQRLFIPSRLDDNPHLAVTDYGKRLAALPDADRKALADGNWDAYTGSVFTLVPGVHTLTWDQFRRRTGHDRIPKTWNRFRVMDWGFAKPFAVYWIAIDFEGHAYAYREWYGCAVDSRGQTRANVGLQMEPTTVATRIASLEQGEEIANGWTGPDLFSAGTGDTSAGITRAEYFWRLNVHFTAWEAGPNSRKAKKSALHERLHYTPASPGKAATVPGLTLIVDPADKATCHHAQRTIPALEYDPAKGGEDVDTTGEDHAYDALAAFCLMRPWQTEKPKTAMDRHFEAVEEGQSDGWTA